jgi:charged multivesicular body protein 6
MDGLKSGNEALKKVHDMMSINEIEKILDETREGVEKQNEIDAILSGSLSPEDLEEVETELEKIMEEENIQVPKDVLLSPESEILQLPNVPETPLPEIQGMFKVLQLVLVCHILYLYY